MLHTHSFTYHPHYIMFLSQYFSFPCQYHSTKVPYTFFHLPPTLYNVSLPALQFSPVSIIPSMLHTHSFTYHTHCIMFLSQYFSFPLSVPFHQCSILIHSPTTHAISCFSTNTSVFPCQYHSTNAPYPFIHLPHTLYNVSLPALQFSPVSIIPPMLHTHSFTYHTHYIMFLSQYFSFPLSVSFHHCSILFSFTYHPRYIMFLSQYFSFPLSVSFHHCSILFSFTYHPRYIMFLSQYFSFPLSVSFHHCSILFSFSYHPRYIMF